MPIDLLAICKVGGALTLKRVVVTQPVQELLEGVFAGQEANFLRDITGEVDFDGSWKPEDDELLRAQPVGDVAALWGLSTQNVIALDHVNPTNIPNEGIRGLCVAMGEGDQRRLLIQNFSARQLLNRGALAFVYEAGVFNQLTQPAFAISNNLSAILYQDFLKFRSYSNVKMIFDLTNVYQEATNAQIDAFGAHGSLVVADIQAFKAFSDQGIRKLVNAVSKKGVLDNFLPVQIVEAAASSMLEIALDNGRLVVPQNRADAKKLLHFLDEGFYRGPLSGVAFITNSKRRA